MSKIPMLALLGATLMSAAPALSAPDAAEVFAKRCAQCHNIGGGHKCAPDLSGVANWSGHNLRRKVGYMQRFAGRLSQAEITMLADYVKRQASKVRPSATGSGLPVAAHQNGESMRGCARNVRARAHGRGHDAAEDSGQAKCGRGRCS